MKPLSGTLAFIGLTVLIVLIAGCQEKAALINNVVYSVEIGNPNANPPEYVDLKNGVADEGKLRSALAKAKQHGGKCDITFLSHASATPKPHYCEDIQASLKTDRVIKSELASNGSSDSSAANDPNLMYRVSSPDPKDITDITALLKQ